MSKLLFTATKSVQLTIVFKPRTREFKVLILDFRQKKKYSLTHIMVVVTHFVLHATKKLLVLSAMTG